MLCLEYLAKKKLEALLHNLNLLNKISTGFGNAYNEELMAVAGNTAH